jgi:hypothetical protein
MRCMPNGRGLNGCPKSQRRGNHILRVLTLYCGNTPQCYQRLLYRAQLNTYTGYLRHFSEPHSAPVYGQYDQTQGSLFWPITGQFILANRRAGWPAEIWIERERVELWTLIDDSPGRLTSIRSERKLLRGERCWVASWIGQLTSPSGMESCYISSSSAPWWIRRTPPGSPLPAPIFGGSRCYKPSVSALLLVPTGT